MTESVVSDFTCRLFAPWLSMLLFLNKPHAVSTGERGLEALSSSALGGTKNHTTKEAVHRAKLNVEVDIERLDAI